MDNETTYLKIPSNSIERIVFYIYEIIEKIINSEDTAYIIKNNFQKKQDLIVKIKEIIDINIIDDKVEKLNDDFSKLFTIKNNYPTLLLKINRILLIFNEEKIKKIYELVKYIANIETSKINNIQLISKDQTSNKKNSSNFEEMKEIEKNQSYKYKDIYNPINYRNITNISEFNQKHNYQTESATKSQINCYSFGIKASNLYPEMINIKNIKEKDSQKTNNDIICAENHKNKILNESRIVIEDRNKFKNKPPIIDKNKNEFYYENTFTKSKEYIANELKFKEKKIEWLSNKKIIDKYKNSNDDFNFKESETYGFPNIKSIEIPIKNSKEEFFIYRNSNFSNFIQTDNETLDLLGKKLKRKELNSNENKLFYNKSEIFNGKSSYEKIKDSNQNTQIKNLELNNVSNSFENMIENSADENHTEINSIPFNTKLIENALNFECHNENSEDLINFDNFSAGIFSNKEITFDENYNSNNEENIIRKTGDIDLKTNDIKENFNGFGNDLYNNIKNQNKHNLHETTFNNKNLNEAKHNDGTEENNYFLEKNNINNFKKFFMSKNSKNDGKTIKSIDDSTTVSTQFTKEKNPIKNFQKNIFENNQEDKIKEQLNMPKEDKNYFDNLEEIKNINKKNKILCNKISTNKNNSQISQCNHAYKNPQKFIIKKYNNLNTYNNNLYIKGKIISKNYSNDTIEKSEDLVNISENSNYNNISTENGITKFSIENDYKRYINSEGETHSKDVFENLLATAKYFDLD